MYFHVWWCQKSTSDAMGLGKCVFMVAPSGTALAEAVHRAKYWNLKCPEIFHEH